MSRLPPQRCATCGQLLPKDKPGAPPADTSAAEAVRRVREKTRQLIAAGVTDISDALRDSLARAPEPPREPEQDALWPGIERKGSE